MVDDFDRDIREDDLAHLPEILKLHDRSMDLPVGTGEGFRRAHSTTSQIDVFTTTSSMSE